MLQINGTAFKPQSKPHKVLQRTEEDGFFTVSMIFPQRSAPHSEVQTSLKAVRETQCLKSEAPPSSRVCSALHKSHRLHLTFFFSTFHPITNRRCTVCLCKPVFTSHVPASPSAVPQSVQNTQAVTRHRLGDAARVGIRRPG